MGYYTEFKIKCKLSKDTPKELIEVLDYFISGKVFEDKAWESYIPNYNHPFFKCSRYSMCLVGSNGSKLDPRVLIQHVPYGQYTLKMHSEFKNYGNEIDKFIDLITPYVVGRKKKQYLGYSHTESGNRYYHHIER